MAGTGVGVDLGVSPFTFVMEVVVSSWKQSLSYPHGRVAGFSSGTSGELGHRGTRHGGVLGELASGTEASETASRRRALDFTSGTHRGSTGKKHASGMRRREHGIRNGEEEEEKEKRGGKRKREEVEGRLREKEKRGGAAAKHRGWERKSFKENPSVWRLGGLGPGWATLSRLKL